MELLNQMPKRNLFGLEKQDYSTAKIVVLPVPYDSTATYKTGSREGPRAIIEASRNIELYSYELGRSLEGLGIYTLDELAPNLSSPEKMIASISKEIGIIIDDKKTPLMLGGEHTITIGAASAFKERGVEMSVIQFDAHTDSRDEIYGSKYTHATVMARVKELYSDPVQVGIRSIDEESAKHIDRERVIFAEEVHTTSAEDLAKKILSLTKENVYLSIDLDVLDPSEMPSVGTPEPGGLSFRELSDLIKRIGKSKNLMGFDVVELSPIPYMIAPDYLAAKLTYLTIGYFFQSQN
ncbi:MAG: agmatinase [Candidatus Micrarchaeaceae archaeon]